MNNLTNDAKFLLTSMYAEYLKRRKEGLSRDKARTFLGTDYVKKHIIPEWTDDDINDTCGELERNLYIYTSSGSNGFYKISLTPKAIVAMEGRCKKRIESILDFIGKIKNLLPFI